MPNHSEIACKHCGELLALSPDHKVVLARPIQTYLHLGEESSNGGESDDADAPVSIPPLSVRRKKQTVELAYERIAQEKKDVTRGFVYGTFFLVFGIVFLLTSLSRLVLVSNDWLNVAGFVFGLVFASMGVYLVLWFRKLSRSLSREEKTLKEEIIHSS